MMNKYLFLIVILYIHIPTISSGRNFTGLDGTVLVQTDKLSLFAQMLLTTIT